MTEQQTKHLITDNEIDRLLWWIEDIGLKPAEDLLKKIKEREYSDLEPKWKPSPPGDTIFDIMEERGISRMKLGYILGLREKSISDLLDGGFLIDNDMACKLSEVLGSSPDFWENRERNYRRELRECFNDDHDCIIRNQTICEIVALIHSRDCASHSSTGRQEPNRIQCKTCIFDGRRECIDHGYPDDCIKPSCEFKIGVLAVIDPIEAQMRNRVHDTAIAQAAREDERRKWRDEHPADLVWMTPEEEEKRIREEERNRPRPPCEECRLVDAARNEAFNEAVEAIQKRIDGIFEAYRGETNKKLTENSYTMANGMGEAQNIIKSLQQPKEHDP